MAAFKPDGLPLIAKRAFDIIAAALVLAVLSPLFMLVRLCRFRAGRWCAPILWPIWRSANMAVTASRTENL
jgi:lipopolysaccharide/colanic/teichoic acid biosynthesis glycosyltransferase